MITIFKKINNGITISQCLDQDCWVNITDPSSDEIKHISTELNIPLSFLTDPLDVDERSRSEIEEQCILLVVRIPQFDEFNIDTPFSTLPLGLILTPQAIVTICAKSNDVMTDFINNKVKNFDTSKQSQFVLQIFYRTALLYLSYLKHIYKRTSSLEKELYQAMKNEELVRLLNLEKSLVYFITSLKSNELMMSRIQRGEVVRMNFENKELLDDVIVENRQAIEMATIYSNILSGMMDAFASVISNNVTVVMKFLTTVTIILMIPTLIASIYGMNVELPFQHSPHAFMITMVISIIFSVIGVFISIKSKWF